MSDVAEPCDRCEEEVAYGFPDGDRWLCRVCDLREDDEINVVIGDGATCECGVETPFRYKPDADPNRVVVDDSAFDLPEETEARFERKVRKAGMWICPRCREIFEEESDDE